MSKTLLASMSDKLWRSHDDTKRLLSFFLPSKKVAVAEQVRANEIRAKQGQAVAKEAESNYLEASQALDPGRLGSDSDESNGSGQSGQRPDFQLNPDDFDEDEQKGYGLHQKIGLFLGPALFILTLLFFHPQDLSETGRAVMAITLWIASWWITEAIPIPATSLLPIILLPMTGALTSGKVTSAYGDPNIFLFMGGFMIAIAMEKWNLHKRIALTIISVMGTSTKLIIFGFMVATSFLSMWISNTAAVMMMVPIGIAITYQLGETIRSDDMAMRKAQDNFDKAMIIGIGYSGTIGGLGTLIGTPPLIILAANLDKLFGYQISFSSWMLFAIPIVLILLVGSWLYLVNIAFPLKIKEIPGGRELIDEEIQELGPASREEKMVFAVFCFAAFMWITRSFFWGPDGLIFTIPNINDTMIAITAGILLFLLPATEKGKFILDWTSAKDLPWGILLLFGGGLAIASGFQESGLAEWIGSQLNVLEGTSLVVMILATTILMMVMTEFTSNTATATMILPILAALALAIDVHPLALMVPAVMAASCAFMMPVGTPPNAIIFSTGRITIVNLITAGFWVNVVAIALIVLSVYFYLPIVLGVDLMHFPVLWK